EGDALTARVIAIDGPAGSGKSTTAKAVAAALGLAHLDSGALYRAITLAALDRSLDLSDSGRLVALASDLPIELRLADVGYVPTISGDDVTMGVREGRVDRNVSEVAALADVRNWVNEALAACAEMHPAGVVVDGRDIGTVVFPSAVLKVYLHASPETRAARRAKELSLHADAVEVRRLTAEILARDAADSGRDVAPLAEAADAVRVDTTELTFDEQVARVVELASAAFDSS
ncbi:MAG: (d)CMP kinase, partial [Gemmatimonadales bacterium]